ncbi:MAG TPA: GIY-YIG nuclease family protein [Gammaproteobacteria bacterium]
MRETGDMDDSSWQVYVIECDSGAWYTGITKDLTKRFKAHAEGKGAKFMRMDKPKRIVAAKTCASKSEALRAEAALKGLGRADKQVWIEQNPISHKDAG